MCENKNKGKIGKIFEDNISISCPEYIFIKKLADNASSWSGGEKTRFASKNECDFIMHNEKNGILYGLELKSTEGSSFTFWREDFEKDKKKETYQIKKNQIIGLKKWNESHKGVFGFLLNFRKKDNVTYFIKISDFINYTKDLNKKRINIKDAEKISYLKIPSRKLKTNYRYDMDYFFNQTSRLVEK